MRFLIRSQYKIKETNELDWKMTSIKYNSFSFCYTIERGSYVVNEYQNSKEPFGFYIVIQRVIWSLNFHSLMTLNLILNDLMQNDIIVIQIIPYAYI